MSSEGLTTPVVISLGELLWDVLPEGKRVGGAPANFAYYASKNGAEAYLVSAIGNDDLGADLETAIHEYGIEAILQKNSHPTGTVGVELFEGNPSFSITKNATWDHLTYTDEIAALAARADAVCYGTLACRYHHSRETISQLIKDTKPECIRYYDVNIRGDYYSKELIEEQLSYASIFKFNEDEFALLRFIFNLQGSEEESVRWFIDNYDLDYAILTSGSRFSVIHARSGEISKVRTPHVRVKDTIGAGDAFSGTLTAELLKGSPLRKAHIKAVNAAAYMCTQPGAWADYPAVIPNYVAMQS